LWAGELECEIVGRKIRGEKVLMRSYMMVVSYVAF
jgi:hypothetical protein